MFSTRERRVDISDSLNALRSKYILNAKIIPFAKMDEGAALTKSFQKTVS